MANPTPKREWGIGWLITLDFILLTNPDDTDCDRDNDDNTAQKQAP